jgi:hypothetical protein
VYGFFIDRVIAAWVGLILGGGAAHDTMGGFAKVVYADDLVIGGVVRETTASLQVRACVGVVRNALGAL